MAVTTDDFGLIQNPATLADTILNLRLIMESDLILRAEIFDRGFITNYIDGARVEFSERNGRQDVVISEFNKLSQNPIDKAALTDAFIAIGRTKTSSGLTNMDARVSLEGGGVQKSSVNYEVLERLLGAKLTLRDPIDLAHYFPVPTTNPKGDHFYYCALTGASGKCAALAKLGPFATLAFLSITIDGASE